MMKIYVGGEEKEECDMDKLDSKPYATKKAGAKADRSGRTPDREGGPGSHYLGR